MEWLATLLDRLDRRKDTGPAGRAKMRAQLQAAQASGTKPTLEQVRAAHPRIQAETLQQLTPVLTLTQLKKFQVLMEEEHGRGGSHGLPRSGDAPSDSTY